MSLLIRKLMLSTTFIFLKFIWIDQISFPEFTGTLNFHKEYMKQITSLWRCFINYKAVFLGSKHTIINSLEHNLFLWHGCTFIEYVSGNQYFTLDMSQLPRCLFGHIHLFYSINFSNLEVPFLVTVVRNSVCLVSERTPKGAPNY